MDQSSRFTPPPPREAKEKVMNTDTEKKIEERILKGPDGEEVRSLIKQRIKITARLYELTDYDCFAPYHWELGV